MRSATEARMATGAAPPATRSGKGLERLLLALIVILVCAGLWQAGSGAWIHLKARLAQVLMAQAWARTLAGSAAASPWPWADTWPVARLRVPRLDVELYVLAGASGRTLAFGPGHLHGTAAPGTAGNSVISAHRDTHFAFLRDLRPGDELILETPDGSVSHYTVDETQVVDRDAMEVLEGNEAPRLTLVTCYPFDALRPNSPLRYVVGARGI